MLGFSLFGMEGWKFSTVCDCEGMSRTYVFSHLNAESELCHGHLTSVNLFHICHNVPESVLCFCFALPESSSRLQLTWDRDHNETEHFQKNGLMEKLR